MTFLYHESVFLFGKLLGVLNNIVCLFVTLSDFTYISDHPTWQS